MDLTDTIPRHVGIIPDGNRRWAKRNGWALDDAYIHASRVLDSMIMFLIEQGIEYVTVWPVSPRNLTRRDRQDILPLMAAVQDYVAFARNVYPTRGIRTHTIGRMDRMRALSPTLADAIESLKAATVSMKRAQVTLALDYDGRQELVSAVKRMLECGVRSEDVTHDTISRHLDTAGMPDPDLIIRTGGDRRLSGFMLFQAFYAEVHFCGSLLPDFKQETMSEILKQFAGRRYSQ